ncbi:MAG: hypothetical protein JWM58_822 [Rhizobium sp.]|nr:hypothetical protein [Rhizobium sp.]
MDMDESTPTSSYRQAGASEEMFLIWFFGLPDEANVADAARVEIARIDNEASSCEHILRLRGLLIQATLNQPAGPRTRKRQRH